jgi:hypothetical protein
MKASERRAATTDMGRRRCPECRNKRLTWVSIALLNVWCEDCGKTGKINEFPYQQHWVDHLNRMAAYQAAREGK